MNKQPTNFLYFLQNVYEKHAKKWEAGSKTLKAQFRRRELFSFVHLSQHIPIAMKKDIVCIARQVRFHFISGVGWDWVHLYVAHQWDRVGLLYLPQMIDECGAVGGMGTERGNRSTRGKPAPVPFRPPHIPHDLTWYLTRTSVVGSWRLTAWDYDTADKCFLRDVSLQEANTLSPGADP
jgi:hypothetical protein